MRVDHRIGCPRTRQIIDYASGDLVDVPGLEVYPATRPGDEAKNKPARQVQVARCTLCGAHGVGRPGERVDESEVDDPDAEYPPPARGIAAPSKRSTRLATPKTES